MPGPEHTYTCDQCGKRAPSEYLPSRGELQPWKLPKAWMRERRTITAKFAASNDLL